MSKQEFKRFWENIKSFPLGMFCDKFTYHWRMTKLPKDCGTCQRLSLGKCSIGKIPSKPNVQGEK